MNANDFKPGDMIRYIPRHAHGEKEHPDCEDGIVTSVGSSYVFCRFVCNDSNGGKRYSGKWRTVANSEACDPDDLIIIVSHKEWSRNNG